MVTAWAMVAAGVLATTGPASAEARDPGRAEALFERARRLSEAGDFVAACPLFAESKRLDPGVGILLYVAACEESVGRLATAWATFHEARAAAETEHQLDRVKIADARIKALEPRLPRARIVVPREAASQGWTIRRGDVVLGEHLWDAEMPVDPGDHRIEVLAPGYQPYVTTLRAMPGRVASVELPPLTRGPAPIVFGPAPGFADMPEERGGRWSPLHTTAVVLGGTGLIGVGLGTGFGVAAAQERPSEGNAAAAATSFALGGAALVAGAVLWFSAPELDTRADAGTRGDVAQGLDLALAEGPGDAGVSLVKRF